MKLDASGDPKEPGSLKVDRSKGIIAGGFAGSPPKGSQIADIARSWQGVPVAVHGRSREGVDCAGLVLCVYAEAGIEIDDPDYQLVRFIDLAEIIFPPLDKALDRLEDSDAWEPGDVLHLRFPLGNVNHLAIYTGNGTMVHAWDSPKSKAVPRRSTVILCTVDHAVRARVVNRWRAR